MKLYNFKCPNCGATLTTDVKNHHARCEYCGNEFHISDETETSAGLDNQEEGKKTPTVLTERTAEEVGTAGDSKRQKKSGSRDFLIVALFLIIGLALNFFFDKEPSRDIVPKTDLHRFFTELHPDITPQNVEALAQKHKLHFFRIDKAVNSDTANINYYKIAKTMDITLGKQDVNAETVEIEGWRSIPTRSILSVMPFYLDTERITAFLQKKRRQKRKPVTIIITTLCAVLPVNRKRTRLT